MQNDYGIAPAALIFGIFVLIISITALIYIAAQNVNLPPVTDTYGNTLSSVSNNTVAGDAGNLTSMGTSTISVPLILLGAVIFICFIVVLIYALSRQWG